MMMVIILDCAKDTKLPNHLPLSLTEPHNLRECLIPVLHISQKPVLITIEFARDAQVFASIASRCQFALVSFNLFQFGDQVIVENTNDSMADIRFEPD